MCHAGEGVGDACHAISQRGSAARAECSGQVPTCLKQTRGQIHWVGNRERTGRCHAAHRRGDLRWIARHAFHSRSRRSRRLNERIYQRPGSGLR